MLTVLDRPHGYCDGVSRRSFLRVGAAGIAGLGLADLLRADTGSGVTTPRAKHVINIYLGGGPTHLDTFDLKPQAPKEFRGEFQPIATSAAGVEICELFPKLASHGNRFASCARSPDCVTSTRRGSRTPAGVSRISATWVAGRVSARC